MMRALALVLVAVLAGALASADDTEPLGPVDDPDRPRFDLAEVQGILAMQRLDGWLLYDFAGQNDIARQIVGPAGMVTRRWFYLIPAKGDPVALVHRVDARAFAAVPGRRVEYTGWRDLETGLKGLLKQRKRIAMEYSPGGALPSFAKVDAGTVEMVKGHGVEVVSSAELVQTAKSRWSKAARASHYVAAHHLGALKDDAFKFIAEKIRAGAAVTEYDVQQRIWRGYATRGITADYPPIVAAGPNTADPHYVPTAAGARAIQKNDLVLIDLWARQEGDPLAVYADITWVAYVGDKVPARYADVFAVVAKARDDTVTFIAEKVKARKPVRGFEADRVARAVVEKAGHGDHFMHRTGHSLDTSVHGDGANLDDFETHDTRTIIQGAGFSVEPGIYLAGDFGVRTEIDCHIAAGGLEITTPVQKSITPILESK